MSDMLLLTNEINRNLRHLNKSICCLTTAVETGGSEGGYNSQDSILLTAGGSDTKTFAIDEIHSYSFKVFSGTAEESIGGGTAVEYTTGKDTEFTMLNSQTISIVCTSGTTIVSWVY